MIKVAFPELAAAGESIKRTAAAVIRKNAVRVFSGGSRREYGMISGCSAFCPSLSD